MEKLAKKIPYLFISPFFIMFGVFLVGPIIYGIWMSFSEMKIVAKPMQFVGMRNYLNLFANPRFYHSLKVTGLYTSVITTLCLLVGLMLAIFLNIKFRGRIFFRTIYFLPVVLSLAISAMIWRLILDDKIGFISIALRSLGFSVDYKWLRDPKLILPSIILISFWRWFGYLMIILLAGLQNIPVELYDAAKIDGASSFRIIWHITLPLLFPIIFFCLVISVINSLKVFEAPFILGGITSPGGPGDNALSTAVYLYISAFHYFNLGYAAAISCVMILIIIGVAVFQTQLLGGKAGIKRK